MTGEQLLAMERELVAVVFLFRRPMDHSYLHALGQPAWSQLALIINQHHLANQGELGPGRRRERARIRSQAPRLALMGAGWDGKCVHLLHVVQSGLPPAWQIHEDEERRAPTDEEDVRKSCGFGEWIWFTIPVLEVDPGSMSIE